VAIGVWLLALLGLAGPGGAQQRTPAVIQTDGGETSVLADRIQEFGGATNLLIAEGNVEIVRGTSRLLADRVELNRDTGEAVAQGKVVFFDGPDRLVGARIDYNLRTGTGVVYSGSAFSAPYYRVSGERMERVGEGIYEIRRGVFTTCEGDDPAWSFRVGSGTVQLDEVVYGRDASFWVGKVPLIPWVPFFAAALRRERQSGFLFPELGQSSRKGFFARVPYYWAISDSQDLTATLDVFTRRGVGLEAEYRYILSRESAGVFSGFGVHEAFRDGRSARAQGLEENRGYATFRHDWQIDRGLSLKIDSTVTSDDRMFREYGDRLGDRSRQRAETTMFLTRQWESWSLVGNFYWYQDLTSTRPVELQRAPEIKFSGVRQPVPGLPWLQHSLESSFTNFVRDVGADGLRVDLHPRLYAPIPVAGLFTLTPFVGGRATYYDKRVVGRRVTRVGALPVEETVDDGRVRWQAEGGLEAETRASRVYELDGAGGIAALKHSIEPRAVLTEIRGVNQKAIPQYDPGRAISSGVDPGYDARVGIDRIGKAHEVTYSLTNRIHAKTVAGPGQEAVRWELMRFVVSQTYNFLPVDQPVKDLFGDLIIQPSQIFRLRADARYNVNGLGLREANADIGLVLPDFSIAVGPRFNEQGGQRFLRAEASARLFRNFDLRGLTYWDVVNGTAIENRVGLDWRFDCWAFGVEYVNRRANEDEVRFSLSLLGVGQTGAKVGAGPR
jgi:LPS-assembly protein